MKRLQRIQGFEITTVGLNKTVKKLARIYRRPRKETKHLLLLGYRLECGLASYRLKSDKTKLHRQLDIIEAKERLN